MYRWMMVSLGVAACATDPFAVVPAGESGAAGASGESSGAGMSGSSGQGGGAPGGGGAGASGGPVAGQAGQGGEGAESGGEGGESGSSGQGGEAGGAGQGGEAGGAGQGGEAGSAGEGGEAGVSGSPPVGGQGGQGGAGVGGKAGDAGGAGGPAGQAGTSGAGQGGCGALLDTAEHCGECGRVCASGKCETGRCEAKLLKTVSGRDPSVGVTDKGVVYVALSPAIMPEKVRLERLDNPLLGNTFDTGAPAHGVAIGSSTLATNSGGDALLRLGLDGMSPMNVSVVTDGMVPMLRPFRGVAYDAVTKRYAWTGRQGLPLLWCQEDGSNFHQLKEPAGEFNVSGVALQGESAYYLTGQGLYRAELATQKSMLFASGGGMGASVTLTSNTVVWAENLPGGGAQLHRRGLTSTGTGPGKTSSIAEGVVTDLITVKDAVYVLVKKSGQLAEVSRLDGNLGLVPRVVVPASDATSLAWDGTLLYIATQDGSAVTVFRAEP